jgi:glycosyltransferase involved in cell wall biosynthesis
MNKKTKICLNAMVANEAPTITRMLESCYKHIDYWVIQDNGSKDGTQDIIRNFFKEKNIPGFLYEIEWQFPGYNRDHTLQECLKSDHGCDWILRMDADERLQVDDDFDWSILDDTSVDSYNLVAETGDLKYFRTWFWNARRPWFFQHDKRHETIHLPEIGEDFERRTMPYGFRHLVSQDGQTWYVPRKFLRDALELEIDKVVGNTVLDDHYHLWYLAKSYSDCYGNSNELPFGKKHSDEYARRAIWYFERCLETTKAWDSNKVALRKDEMSYIACILMARAYGFMGEHDKAMEHFNLSEQFAPGRNEHYLYLCYYLEEKNKYEDILKIIDIMSHPDKKNPFPNYSYLVEGKCYLDTSNFLMEYKERVENKINSPSINLDSIKFDFN